MLALAIAILGYSSFLLFVFCVFGEFLQSFRCICFKNVVSWSLEELTCVVLLCVDFVCEGDLHM